REKILGRKLITEKNELESILIEADFGFDLASKISSELSGLSSEDDIFEKLTVKLNSILSPLIKDFDIGHTQSLFVITVVGVNGSGKTTTVAKIANLLKTRGYSVSIAACDTFRVSAIEQLSVWASKLNCPIFKSDINKDPASVAYNALQSATTDVLIIDTSGRLPNNINLMNELSKIYRAVNKVNTSAPHMNILIIDATTGQNALEQAREFGKIYPISGIIMSKMGESAKGGTIVRISNELKIPIIGVGTGEKETNIERFSIEKFLEDLRR
ncbi:MAG: signal recognition particle-docking protein FtsY, partial [Holosporales bacterium]|nr:signal recognition particle-docking protein FtsY [Holosporales bacterium]